MKAVKFLVIGTGAIGNRHAQNIIELGHECEIVSYRNLVDLEKVLSKGSFNAVIVATASQVRLEVLAPCFRNMIPVYIEKPVAFDIETIDEIYRLPSNYLKKCFVGFMMRFHPLTQFLLNLDYSSTYNFSFDIGYDVNKWRPNWKFSKSYASKKQGGGVLLDLCHEIDLAYLLFSPLALIDVLSLDHDGFKGVDFCSLITFTNRNSLTGSVSVDYLCPVNRRKLIVKGKDFIDEVDFITGAYIRLTNKKTTVKNFPIERNQMFIEAMYTFTQAVLGIENRELATPSLNRMKSSCELIANAWKKRVFVGSIKAEIL